MVNAVFSIEKIESMLKRPKDEILFESNPYLSPDKKIYKINVQQMTETLNYALKDRNLCLRIYNISTIDEEKFSDNDLRELLSIKEVIAEKCPDKTVAPIFYNYSTFASAIIINYIALKYIKA